MKLNKMGIWTHIILEAFCMFDHASKKKHTYIDMDGKNEHVRINEHFISPKKRPLWCKKFNKKRVPQFKCMCYGKSELKCPFFSYCNVDKKDYKIFDNAYSKEKT